jgi:hypothetical protein
VISLNGKKATEQQIREQLNAMRNIYRRAILIGSSVVALASMSAANAQPSLTALAALLIDIPGWQAEKPNTMNATQGGITVSYAARQYEQGEKQMMTMLGRSGIEQQIPMVAGNRQDNFSMEADGVSVRLRTLRTFRVVTVYETESKGGMVLVYLGANTATTFVLQFDGITLDEALAHSQRFDWAAMQRALGGR